MIDNDDTLCSDDKHNYQGVFYTLPGGANTPNFHTFVRLASSPDRVC